jgi:hypothetical protein
MAIQNPDMGKGNRYVCVADDGAESKVGVGSRVRDGRSSVFLGDNRVVSEVHGHW